MGMPNYATSVTNSFVTFNTAITTRDGSGALTTLISADGTGLILQDIMFHATATTTAGFIFLYLSDGTTNKLIMEHPVTAITPSATVSAWSSFISDFNLCLQAGWSLKVSTYKAESFNACVLRAALF